MQIVHQQLDAEPATGGQEAGSDGSQAADPPRVSYYLDGAHTPESMATCAHWFASACQPAQPSGAVQRVLIFNCMQVPRSSQTCCLIDVLCRKCIVSSMCPGGCCGVTAELTIISVIPYVIVGAGA